MSDVLVRAKRAVLGLTVGQEVTLPMNMPGVRDLLATGQLVRLDENGEEIPTKVRPRGKCCGRTR